MIIKKGTIVAITTGEYSDYCLDGHVIALKDFDPQEQARIFQAGNVIQEYHGREAFLSYLIINGFIDPTEKVVELWLGTAYGGLQPDEIDVTERSAISDDPPHYSPSQQHVT
jgi:hypothetical protein